MTELLTAAQMRAIEQAAIDSGKVTGLELMERAGQGVVEAIFEEWPELAKGERRAVVLCGPGNNGGDGFVVARLLKEQGWEVEVFLYGDPEKLPPDAKVNFERWARVGAVEFIRSKDTTDYLYFADFDVAVDALFGTGLTRSIPESTLHWAFFFNDSQSKDGTPHTVAVDLPSGLDTDGGGIIGEFAIAPVELTVTFHKEKVGLTAGNGPRICGKVVVKDIGL
ncbi:MAG: NAD(P)H-hydrate epimerase [Boseongicola sp.]|nr:MAG: NAD(P)H-hydrate epimerase [Boseongicola sp.]